MLEQGGEGGQPVAYCHAAQSMCNQVVAPDNEMRARDDPGLARLLDPRKTHEVLKRVLVRPASTLVVDVGEPTRARAVAVSRLPMFGRTIPSATSTTWISLMLGRLADQGGQDAARA